MPELYTHSKSKPRLWNYLGERVRRDFLFQAASGTMPGVMVLQVNGFTDNLGQTLQPIWPGAGAYDYFTRSQPLSISSDSVNDTFNGTGASVIRILGLDDKLEIQMEDVPLKGLTSVLSQGVYLRVLSVAVLKAGELKSAAGIITLIGKTDSKIVGTVQAPFNKMTNGLFTVPAHTNAYIFHYSFNMGAPKETTTGIRFLTPVADNPCWLVDGIEFMYGGGFDKNLEIPFYYPEKTDIEFIGMINVDSNTYISCLVQIVLIDETFEWEQLTSQDEQCGVTR